MSPAGRPEIGQPINVRLGDDLLLIVDRMAHRLGISRAETIRRIVDAYFANETPTTEAVKPVEDALGAPHPNSPEASMDDYRHSAVLPALSRRSSKRR